MNFRNIYIAINQNAFVKKKNEVFGQGIWDFFLGKEATEFVERDDGFIALSTGIPS